jgi:hypothetical protein
VTTGQREKNTLHYRSISIGSGSADRPWIEIRKACLYSYLNLVPPFSRTRIRGVGTSYARPPAIRFSPPVGSAVVVVPEAASALSSYRGGGMLVGEKLLWSVLSLLVQYYYTTVVLFVTELERPQIRHTRDVRQVAHPPIKFTSWYVRASPSGRSKTATNSVRFCHFGSPEHIHCVLESGQTCQCVQRLIHSVDVPQLHRYFGDKFVSIKFLQ